MKNDILHAVIIMVGIITLMACGTSPSGTNNSSAMLANRSNAILMWQSEIEEYVLSNHDQNNNLVYFFIQREGRDENAFAFIITDQMDDSERMDCLVYYTMTNTFPGFRLTEESYKWFNDYSPVVISDNYRGTLLAVFSLPRNVNKIWILVQNITKNKDVVNNNAFPLIDFKLNEEPVQYYLINASAGDVDDAINLIDRTEMEKCIKKTTSYAMQVGTKIQPGFIIGKGQEPHLAE